MYACLCSGEYIMTYQQIVQQLDKILECQGWGWTVTAMDSHSNISKIIVTVTARSIDQQAQEHVQRLGLQG